MWTKFHQFPESGGFPIFAPIAISPPFLNFGPQNFGVKWRCWRVFLKCHHEWTKVFISFEKMGVFRFSPSSLYLRHFWTLAHKILGSCSPTWELSKSVTISGPEFIICEKVGVLRFSLSSPHLCRFKANGHRFMGIRSLSLPFYVATPITLSVKEFSHRLRFSLLGLAR